MTRVLIVDDHELIREGIKKILRGAHDLRLVSEAGSLSEALEHLKRRPPELVILDMDLVDATGLSGLVKIKAQCPNVPVLVLSMFREDRYALPCIKAGAAGYVSKTMAAEELLRAIDKVMSGGTYLSAAAAELLAEDVRDRGKRKGPDTLTPRELQVLSLITRGMQPKEIASDLGLSLSSVNTYRARIFEKLDLANDRQLIRYAMEAGLAK